VVLLLVLLRRTARSPPFQQLSGERIVRRRFTAGERLTRGKVLHSRFEPPPERRPWRPFRKRRARFDRFVRLNQLPDQDGG
jgi:hypothetical protein